MPRMVDARCLACDIVIQDLFVDAEAIVLCKECGKPLEQMWWIRPTRNKTEWDEKDAVIVFKKPDGTYSYPAVNNKPTPKGYERIVMRSLRAVEAFEKRSGVRNEAMHFDRNGRGFDT